MLRSGVVLSVLLLLAWLVSPAQSLALLPNGSFESGAFQPDGWSISPGGTGRWERFGHEGGRALSVTGRGEEALWWQAPVRLEPGRLYHTSFWVKRMDGGSGTVLAGLNLLNRDYSAGPAWESRGFFFRTPAALPESLYRLGERRLTGTICFDDASITPAFAAYAQPEGRSFPLGEGETIVAGRYTAEHHLAGPGATDARFLDSFTAAFDSTHWCFSPGTQVVYRHEVGQLKQSNAQVALHVSSYRQGKLAVEWSEEGRKWTPLGAANRLGGYEFTLPVTRLPQVWVRLRAVGEECDLQVDTYRYECELPNGAEIARAVGTTHYFDLLHATPDLAATVSTSGDTRLRVELQSPSRRRVEVLLSLQQQGQEVGRDRAETRLRSDRPVPVNLTLPPLPRGESHALLTVRDPENHQVLWQAQGAFVAP